MRVIEISMHHRRSGWEGATAPRGGGAMSVPANPLPSVFLKTRCLAPFELPFALKKHIEHEAKNTEWQYWNGPPEVYTSLEQFKTTGDNNYYVIKKTVTGDPNTRLLSYAFQVKSYLNQPLFQDNNDPYFDVNLEPLGLIKKRGP